MRRADVREPGLREPWSMFEATLQRPREIDDLNAQLQEEAQRLRTENERLRSENRHLRAAVDAHVRRAQSTALFGPIELSAGTCTGPRRGLEPRHEGAR